jgi:hypothetical protein
MSHPLFLSSRISSDASMQVDSTQGAQFIGFTVSTMYVQIVLLEALSANRLWSLYGIGCLQMLIYITQNRTMSDKLWLKLLSVCIL